MLARVQIQLPRDFYVSASLQGKYIDYQLGDTNVRFFAPYRSQIGTFTGESYTSPGIIKKLAPEEPISIDTAFTINDEATYKCNAIQIDFKRGDFDRRRDGVPNPKEPSVDLIFSTANSWLSRLRFLTAGFADYPTLDPQRCNWRLIYLNDDATPLDRSASLLPGLDVTAGPLPAGGVSIPVWEAMASLPIEHSPPSWYVLLLDAEALKGQVGPAVVLAFTALETRIAMVLDELARSHGVNEAIWSWLTTQNDPTRRPSTSDQFDPLLKAVSGHTLKEESSLWEGFRNLRAARNSFVHQGEARIGSDRVDWARAIKLIRNAHDIVGWLNNLLPNPAETYQFEIHDSYRMTLPVVDPSVSPEDFDPDWPRIIGLVVE